MVRLPKSSPHSSSTALQLDDRWWFWVIIGIIAAFFVVAVAFVIRGFRMYKRYKAIVLQV